MYLSSSDGINGVDVDDSFQIRQGNTPPVTSDSTQLPSPSCPTLLVIDDNSNSDDSSLNLTDIPSNSIPLTTQGSHVQVTPSSPSSTIDAPNDTPEQQRRRNSSVAKLLGGQPLNNQQYKEINQQLLDAQSAQIVTNSSDNGTDGGIPRTRSSITRNLLMNAERNNNNNTPTTITKPRSSSPEFSKDFEYLIRRELDIEHAPSTLRRNSSTPSVFQNLSSARNAHSTHAQSTSQSKLKRKRHTPKPAVLVSTTNKPSNISPFVIRDPFELESSAPSLVPPINPTPIHRSHHQQNDLYLFDGSHRHHRLQTQQQYSVAMNHSPTNLTPFAYHKLNRTSPAYTQFKIHHDRLPIPTSCSSSSCYCCRYPPTAELTLSTPVSPTLSHTPSPTVIPHHTTGTLSRKTKATYSRPDICEVPIQRSYSTISNQSNVSSSSSSGHSVPLKKRLLHAYKNEQSPSSLL